MSNNPHLERARLLMQMSRFELAEEQLRLSLADDSSDAQSHALLSLCVLSQERFEEAEAEARQAIGSDPEEALGFYALAALQQTRGLLPKAFETIQEAIRLESWNAAFWGLLASIEYGRYRWKDSLAAAEKGLEFDPEDVTCTNLQAKALVQLGRHEEAGVTIARALDRDPDNAETHANQGWRYLHEGNPNQAMIHFREALRLEPNSEWARRGIIEAMKARHFIYRWMLAFFLWMTRLPPTIQFALILGLMFGNQIFATVCRFVPFLTPFQVPIFSAYLLFAWMSWVAPTLFNAVLCLNSFGRMALNRREKLDAGLLIGCIAVATSIGITGHVIASGVLWVAFWFTAMLWLGLAIPLTRTFSLIEHQDRRWWLMMAYTVGLSVVIVVASASVVQMATGLVELDAKFVEPLSDQDKQTVEQETQKLVEPFVMWSRRGLNGIVLATWIGSLIGVVPTRR